MIELAPSLLSADFAEIGREIATVEAGGADALHLDVMDGRFVPNITWGPKIVHDLRRLSSKPFDVHLMIVEPERYVDQFRDAGCDLITFHYEATVHVQRLLAHVRELGARAGLALNPSTPIEVLDDLIDDVDVVLMMSVNPGFGGQAFLPRTLPRIRRTRALIDARGVACRIEVDGGIGRATIADAVAAGATSFVAGSSVFGAADPAEELRVLRRLAEDALPAAAR